MWMTHTTTTADECPIELNGNEPYEPHTDTPVTTGDACEGGEASRRGSPEHDERNTRTVMRRPIDIVLWQEPSKDVRALAVKAEKAVLTQSIPRPLP
jgi:hypothetical protein